MTDLERLKLDLEEDPRLAAELQRSDGGAEEWARWAQGRGYDITAAEAEELAATDELSDDDLEKVAGGWPDGSSGGG